MAATGATSTLAVVSMARAAPALATAWGAARAAGVAPRARAVAAGELRSGAARGHGRWIGAALGGAVCLVLLDNAALALKVTDQVSVLLHQVAPVEPLVFGSCSTLPVYKVLATLAVHAVVDDVSAPQKNAHQLSVGWRNKRFRNGGSGYFTMFAYSIVSSATSAPLATAVGSSVAPPLGDSVPDCAALTCDERLPWWAGEGGGCEHHGACVPTHERQTTRPSTYSSARGVTVAEA